MSNPHSQDDAIDTAIELAERIEVLSKVVIDGNDSKPSGDLMISSADAFVAACMIIETARNQKQILCGIASVKAKS